MKGIIIYATKSGNTKAIVDKLKKIIKGNFDVVNVQELSNFSVDPYDKVIIGTHVRRDRINEEIMSFIEKNKNSLLKKKLYVFVSAAKTGEEYDKQITNSFPKELLEQVKVYNLGTKYNPDSLNFVERVVVRNIAQDQGINVDDLNPITQQKIENFAEIVNSS